MFVNIRKIKIQDPVAFMGESMDIKISDSGIRSMSLDIDLGRLVIYFESPNVLDTQVINLDRVLSYTYERMV